MSETTEKQRTAWMESDGEHLNARCVKMLLRDYAALEAAAREARDALVIAEIALCNCVPVVPYKGDGPLVKLRETLAHLDRVMGGK